jgi:cobalt-zinc-cadmium efflux system membrane fusion protein
MELAERKSEYLEALEHRKLARSTFEREERLWRQGISAEQEYLAAQNALAEAEIAVNLARQALLALQVTAAEIDKLAADPNMPLTKYKVYASTSGRIVEKHVSRGELLGPEQEAFTLADLSRVWVNLFIHQRDLEQVRVGQSVKISLPEGGGDIGGTIDYIEPVIGEESRMATARVTLKNPDGDWRPGLFVTGRVQVSADDAAVLVPQDAVQSVDGRTVVFVQDEHGFEPRPVTLGRQNEDYVEITEGLSLGEKYVAENAFLVKAELGKATAEHAH